MRHLKGIVASCLGLLLFSNPQLVNAASVAKVKGKGVLLEVDDVSVSSGDKVFATDSDGKKKAIIQIVKVKGGKATGKILKGNASEGMGILAGSGGGGGKSGGGGGKKGKSHFGLTAGAHLITQSLVMQNSNATQTETVAASGTAFGVSALLDIALAGFLDLRGLFGYHGFSVTGTSNLSLCGNGTTKNCATTITYLNFEGIAKLNLVNSGSLKFWLGPSAGILFPVSSSSNALDPGSIGLTAIFGGGAGLDLFFGGIGIPLEFDYVLLPSSSLVTTSMMRIKLGLLF